MHMHPLDPLLQLDASQITEYERRSFIPLDRRWNGDGPAPEIRILGGATIPVLREIHPRHWEALLTPLRRDLRRRAVYLHPMSHIEAQAALALLDWLLDPPQDLARKAIAERVGALPEAGPVHRPAGRQVNVRVSAREYEDLQAAAEIAGTTPTTLARWFLLSGTRRVLADHAATYGDTRGRR
jgi:hypothetical protein